MSENKHNLENAPFIYVVKAGALALGFVAAAKLALGTAILGTAAYTACSVVQALVPNKETKDTVPSFARRFAMAMMNPFSAKLEERGRYDEFERSSVIVKAGMTLLFGLCAFCAIAAPHNTNNIVGLGLSALFYPMHSILLAKSPEAKRERTLVVTREEVLKQLSNPFSLHLPKPKM